MLLHEIRSNIRKLEANGFEGIKVIQAKRIINADVISVGGKWYPVTTTPCAGVTISVTYEQKEIPWMDENGRAISEVQYE